jgi:hypothetical protein
MLLPNPAAYVDRLAQIVAFFAENEQNMNSVERLIAYAELPGEGAAATPEDPPNSWPDRGEIIFKNVDMSYREGLPLVLKGVTFTMRPGEKANIPHLAVVLHLLYLIHPHRLVLSGELEPVGIALRDGSHSDKIYLLQERALLYRHSSGKLFHSGSRCS